MTAAEQHGQHELDQDHGTQPQAVGRNGDGCSTSACGNVTPGAANADADPAGRGAQHVATKDLANTRRRR